jgi:hypothetical protein
MSRDNATIVRRFVDEVITQGNIEAAAQYVWEDSGQDDSSVPKLFVPRLSKTWRRRIATPMMISS